MEATTETKKATKAKATIKVDPEAEKNEAQAGTEKGKEKKTKEPQTPQQFLDDYVAKKDSCAAAVTKQMINGATLDELVAVATTFNLSQAKGKQWGQKTGDLRSHFRWLQNDKHQLKVTEENGVFKVSA